MHKTTSNVIIFIPCRDLDLKDQIGLIKAGCSEVLFIKANYTYDAQRKALTLGPDILYTRQSFLQGTHNLLFTVIDTLHEIAFHLFRSLQEISACAISFSAHFPRNATINCFSTVLHYLKHSQLACVWYHLILM